MHRHLLSSRVSLLSLALLGAPGLSISAAKPEHGPARVASRSGSGYDTWDLGPDPLRPGQRLYRLSVGGARSAALTQSAATNEFVLAFGDGRELRFNPELPTGDRLAPLPEMGAPGPQIRAPREFSSWRPEGSGAQLHLLGGARGWVATLRLSPGLILRRNRPGAGVPLQVLDEHGVPLAELSLPERGLKVEASGDDAYRLTLARKATAVNENDAPDFVDVAIAPSGTYGGYQCNIPAGLNAPGTANNANPSSTILIGENLYFSGNTQNTCDGYLRWDLAGLLPATALVTALNISPLNVASFTGAAQTLHVTDVTWGNVLPFSTGATYNAVYWSDFNTMTAGRPEYGTGTVSGTGNLAAPIVLGQAALDDIRALLKSGSPAYFAAGFYTPAIAQNNYFNLRSDLSLLGITYSAAPSTQVVLNRLHLDAPASSGKGELDLYNYGDDADLSGWIVRSYNFNNLTESYTLPAGTTLRRQSHLKIIDGPGIDTTSTLYTGGGRFHWGKTAAPYNVTVALLMGDGTGEDYTCWGGAVAAPPAGSGWAGSCLASAPGEGGDVHRFYDSDTDSATDWALTAASGASDLLPGQYGSRRRSDIFVDQVLSWTGFNWLKLVNYGPAVDLNGWSLVFYDNAGTQKIYPFTSASPLNPGETMWLAEGNTTFTGGAYGPADNRHRNMGITLSWGNSAPYGGEIILRDGGLRARDYLPFGTTGTPHLPPEISWLGAPIGPLTVSTQDLYLDTDLSTRSAFGWTVVGGFTSIAQWNGLNPNQQGYTRHQDELGGTGQWFQNDPGAAGNGEVVQIARQVGLEEFALDAAPVAAPRNGLLVVKKQGSATTLFSRTVSLATTAQQRVSTGRINPPLKLDPGVYAFMLYLDGAWSDNERFNSKERISFGAAQGVTTESGFAPSAAFSVNYPYYASHLFASTINPPVIGAGAVPAGMLGILYNYTETVSGGFGAPWNWQLVAGSLPAGISLSAAGILSGTPGATGTYFYTVQVTDAAGLSSTLAQTLTIEAALSVTTTVLKTGNVGISYSQTLASTSTSAASISWALQSGALPAGLTLSTLGVISGVPSAGSAGTYPLTVKATDTRFSINATAALSLRVFVGSVLQPLGVPVEVFGELGTPFTQQINAVGGTPPYLFSLLYGSLPAGISLNTATGLLSGTPTAVAHVFNAYRVTDAEGQVADYIYVGSLTPGNEYLRDYRITIFPALGIDNGALPDYTGGSIAYAAPLVAHDGAAPYTFTCTLPAAFAGVLACTQEPNYGQTQLMGSLAAGVADGIYPVSVQVTDSLGVIVNGSFTMRVDRALAIVTGVLANGYVGFDYGVQRVIAKGGSGTGLWSISAGALPGGLSLDGAAGTITGTPTTAGAYSATLTFQNNAGRINQTYPIQITQPSVPPYWVRRGLSGGTLYPAFSPSYSVDRTILAVAPGRQIAVSHDAGLFWQLFSIPSAANSDGGEYAALDNLGIPVPAPGFDGRAVGTPGRPAGANQIIVLNRSYSGVWYSDDLGVTWTQMNSGLENRFGVPYVGAFNFIFAPDFQTTKRAFVMSWNSQLRSNALYSAVIDTVARTANWTRVSPASVSLGQYFYPAVITVSPDYAADHALYMTRFLAYDNNNVYDFNNAVVEISRSTNDGAAWTVVNRLAVGTDLYLHQLRFSPNFATDRTLALVAPTIDLATGNFALNGFYISHDAGVSFVQRGVGHFLYDVQFPRDYNPATRPVFYASEFLDTAFFTAQLYRTDDDGVNLVNAGSAGMSQDQYGGSFWLSPNFDTDQMILANGNGAPGLFRSENGGAAWGPSDGGVASLPINTVVHAPDYATSGRIMASTFEAIYYTDDRGATWRKASLPRAANVIGLRFSPAYSTDRKVFAYACRTTCQLLRSTDGGKTFSELSQQTVTPFNYQYFQISPNFVNDHTLFVGDLYTQLYRSTDEGVTFTRQLLSQNIRSFGLSPGFATDKTLYANTTSSAQRAILSTNADNPDAAGGLSYTANPYFIPPSLTGSQPSYISWSPPHFTWNYNQASGVNGAASRTFIWSCRKSTDGGNTFATIPASGSGCNPFDRFYGRLEFSPDFGTDSTLLSFVRSGIFTGQQSGLYKSVNGGNSFSLVTYQGNPFAFSNVNQIEFSPAHAQDREIMLATASGLYSSADAGVTWSKQSGFNPFPDQVTAIVQDSLRRGTVFVGTQGGRVFKSDDDGVSADEVTANLLAGAIQAMTTTGSSVTRLLAATPLGVFQRVDFTANGFWSLTGGGAGDIRSFLRDSTGTYATRADGPSLKSTDGGLTWTAMAANLSDAVNISRVPGGAGFAESNPPPQLPASSIAGLWAASQGGGARWSTDYGASWNNAPGQNDYTLPAASGWSVVQALGLNAAGTGRLVLIGNNNALPANDPAKGVFLSRDGGDTWRNVSLPGSGLEATSKNLSAVLSAATSYGTTDVLVGVNGATTGGVYLSGDSGEHWIQVNQGFDPTNLSISSLVTTSCGGCPVQYYSGSYGGGMYTRTITVAAPPFYTTPATWCAGNGCTCAGATASLQVSGGQSFKICGSNFQNGAVVEFDGVPASGCTVTASLISCTASPAHANGASVVRVRNPDTRTGTLLASAFQFSGGVSRAGNSLRVAKVTGSAALTWTCAACTAPTPARVYRSQNSAFSLYLEQYNGGIGGAYTNTNAVATAQSYFWTVE